MSRLACPRSAQSIAWTDFEKQMAAATLRSQYGTMSYRTSCIIVASSVSVDVRRFDPGFCRAKHSEKRQYMCLRECVPMSMKVSCRPRDGRDEPLILIDIPRTQGRLQKLYHYQRRTSARPYPRVSGEEAHPSPSWRWRVGGAGDRFFEGRKHPPVISTPVRQADVDAESRPWRWANLRSLVQSTPTAPRSRLLAWQSALPPPPATTAPSCTTAPTLSSLIIGAAVPPDPNIPTSIGPRRHPYEVASRSVSASAIAKYLHAPQHLVYAVRGGPSAARWSVKYALARSFP